MTLVEDEIRAASPPPSDDDVEALAEERTRPVEEARLPDLVRAFGVMLGGSLVLVGAAAASFAVAARSAVKGRRPPVWALAGTAALGAHALAIRPWMRGWGTEPEERSKPLPGDELVPGDVSQTTRAVTVEAPVDEVWPWLAQVGQDRGGFYSYQWLENLAGCGTRNVDRVHPEWQHREVGEKVLLHRALGLEVTRFEPGRVLALEDWGAFVVEPLEDGRTRVLVRERMNPGPGRWVYTALLEIPHFLMERRMLLGIKERAEGRRRRSRLLRLRRCREE